jgi:hypothetical protein
MQHDDIQLIELSKIKIDGGTQQRDVDKDIRDEYAQLIREGVDLPPVEVVFDGKRYWLWDGFHRYQAHIAAEADCIMAHITDGKQRDAVWLSFGANKDHGLRRKAEDVRKIIATIKADPIWSAKTTQKQIAEIVGVSLSTVEKIYAELDSVNPETRNLRVIGQAESDTEPEDDGEPELEETEPSPGPTTRDAKPMVDRVGNELPRNLVDVFLKGKEIQSMSRTLSTIENEFVNLCSTHNLAVRHFPFDRFKVDIENARNDIRCAEPYAVCPYCKGKGKSCKACKAAGWITKSMYEHAPRELK